MRNFSKKQKIAFIFTVVFFITSAAVRFKNFIENIQYMYNSEKNTASHKNLNQASKEEIDEKIHKNSYRVLVGDLDKKTKENLETKEYILKLSNTLGEAIDYIKASLNNKDKSDELITLIEDCINALKSIENALNKSKDRDGLYSLIKDTASLNKKFKELKLAFDEGDGHKLEEIFNSCIEKEYNKWKENFNLW